MIIKLKNGAEIHIKKKNRGKFTSYCGGKVTSACIAKAKRSGNPTLVKRATFAANARKWKHQYGGIITTSGAGYIPSFNLGAVAQDLRNQAYRRVRPTGYTYDNARSFFKNKKGRLFGDPNTEGLWGMYTGQDSVVADRTQAPEGLPTGRLLTVKEAVSYGYSPEDDNVIRNLAKYAVKDIVIPSKSKQGAYELAYPNQPGNVPHLPYNSNDVPENGWPHSHQLGTFNQIKGTDERGTNVIYKDTWDINPFRGQSSEDDSSWGWLIKTGKNLGLDKVGDLVPFGKPFEIYGKQYYDKNGNPIKLHSKGGKLCLIPRN